MSRRDDLRKLINYNYRRLQKLKEKQAYLGSIDAPPHIEMSIEDTEAEVARLEIELKEIVLSNELTVSALTHFRETSLLTKNSQHAILAVLFIHHQNFPDSPALFFTDLYVQLSELFPEIQMSKIRSKLFGLQRRKLIDYESSEEGQVNRIWIDRGGIDLIQKMQAENEILLIDPPIAAESTVSISADTKPEQNSVDAYPMTLEDLAQQDEDCARFVKRTALLEEILACFKRPSSGRHFIVLSGEPMVGKTSLLNRLSHYLDDKYVPIMVTEQGLGTLEKLDAFLFDLSEQIVWECKDWARKQRISINLNLPDRNDFNEGRGKKLFRRLWRDVRRALGERRPVLMFDEVEYLLRDRDELDRRILKFLHTFIRDPKNGYFIVAGSERIHHQEDEDFRMLIAKGWPIRVSHFDEKTTQSFFSALKKYFTLSDYTIQHCLALCGGHPRVLELMFATVVHQADKLSAGRMLEQGDVELILNKTIERTKDLLWALWRTLDDDEAIVVWLISRTVSQPVGKMEYSVTQLAELAEQYSIKSPVDYYRIKQGASFLAEREWLQWKNQEREFFDFKLGIFPFWIHRCYISPDEVVR